MSGKRNYQKELDGIIENTRKQGAPTLLLHACCAVCGSYCLEYLSEFFKITVFFYNPNIEPADEFEHRASELKRLIGEMKFRHSVSYIEGVYDPDRFHEAVRGLENEPEGGKRCDKCFRIRLSETAELARKLDFDYFTTTLTVSPLKSSEKLNNIGEEEALNHGTAFLNSDFKKRGGYQRSIELSKEYCLYRQNFCGCVYSRKNK